MRVCESPRAVRSARTRWPANSLRAAGSEDIISVNIFTTLQVILAKEALFYTIY
jgi:hypothetical protein